MDHHDGVEPRSRTSPRSRELGALAPHVSDFLAADFNYDWDLDHADAESLFDAVLDRLRPSERTSYISEARVLERALTDDEGVMRFLRWVGVGMRPEVNFGQTPVEWLGGLVERLENPRTSGWVNDELRDRSATQAPPW